MPRNHNHNHHQNHNHNHNQNYNKNDENDHNDNKQELIKIILYSELLFQAINEGRWKIEEYLVRICQHFVQVHLSDITYGKGLDQDHNNNNNNKKNERDVLRIRFRIEDMIIVCRVKFDATKTPQNPKSDDAQ